MKGIIEPNGDVLWTAPVRPLSRRSSYVAIVGGRTIYGRVVSAVGEITRHDITAHDTNHVDVMAWAVSSYDGHVATEATMDAVNRVQRSLVRRFTIHPIFGINEELQRHGENPMGVLTLDDIQGTPTLGKMPAYMRKFLDYYIWITE